MQNSIIKAVSEVLDREVSKQSLPTAPWIPSDDVWKPIYRKTLPRTKMLNSSTRKGNNEVVHKAQIEQFNAIKRVEAV